MRNWRNWERSFIGWALVVIPPESSARLKVASATRCRSRCSSRLLAAIITIERTHSNPPIDSSRQTMRIVSIVSVGTLPLATTRS